MSVMQITGQLEQETGWSKQAVISFLKRMEAKGLVTYEQKGRTRYIRKKPLQKGREVHFCRTFIMADWD